MEDLDNGKLAISSDSGYEDIHSFVEGTLTERIGEAGKRLHTGRSRNDQVALDMKLYTRDEIDTIEALVKELLEELLAVMEKNTDTFMPGFTHLQKAQPITLAHHMGAYFEMFSRDRSRLKDIRRRMNYCPLGSGALAGTTYPLDREYTAELLGFDGPTLNSMDSVADRDYLIELLSALSTISMHLSRFCEEIIIWNTNEYRFVEIDDSYSTGSSIMPQKKNPDIIHFQLFFIYPNDFFHGLLAGSPYGKALLHTGLHADGLIYVLLKHRTDGLVFFQAEIIQGNSFGNASKDQLSHDAVGIPERHSLIHQIIRRICGIGKAVLCTGLHYLFPKAHRGNHAGKQGHQSGV